MTPADPPLSTALQSCLTGALLNGTPQGEMKKLGGVNQDYYYASSGNVDKSKLIVM